MSRLWNGLLRRVVTVITVIDLQSGMNTGGLGVSNQFLSMVTLNGDICRTKNFPVYRGCDGSGSVAQAGYRSIFRYGGFSGSEDS